MFQVRGQEIVAFREYFDTEYARRVLFDGVSSG